LPASTRGDEHGGGAVSSRSTGGRKIDLVYVISHCLPNHPHNEYNRFRIHGLGPDAPCGHKPGYWPNSLTLKRPK